MSEENDYTNNPLDKEEWEDSSDEPRPLERWAPVGANDVDDEMSCNLEEYNFVSEAERLRHLESEQEQLNGSLLALTSHFAQVQFRLKQIVDAEPDEKEDLLKSLEEFAFRGIPDTRSYVLKPTDVDELIGENHEQILTKQREKQKELIEQLKVQLEELERYAYETGDADMPQSMVMEKQKVIIDELKGKLPINLDEFHALSSEELRKQVDCAISQEKPRVQVLLEKQGVPVIAHFMAKW